MTGEVYTKLAVAISIFELNRNCYVAINNISKCHNILFQNSCQ